MCLYFVHYAPRSFLVASGLNALTKASNSFTLSYFHALGAKGQLLSIWFSILRRRMQATTKKNNIHPESILELAKLGTLQTGMPAGHTDIQALL